MNKLRTYITLVQRHAHHGGKRQAVSFALRHWRFWHGAVDDGRPYVHIGSRASTD